MDQDLYAILGVSRTASNDEVRRAYRKLAKDLHPDQHKGDPKTEDAFKRVSAAFAIVGNPEKRKRYDAGEIDAMGNERANPFYGDYTSAGGTSRRKQRRRRWCRFFRSVRRPVWPTGPYRLIHYEGHGFSLQS